MRSVAAPPSGDPSPLVGGFRGMVRCSRRARRLGKSAVSPQCREAPAVRRRLSRPASNASDGGPSWRVTVAEQAAAKLRGESVTAGWQTSQMALGTGTAERGRKLGALCCSRKIPAKCRRCKALLNAFSGDITRFPGSGPTTREPRIWRGSSDTMKMGSTGIEPVTPRV